MSAAGLLLALSLAYAGMLGICLSMVRHWQKLVSPDLPENIRRACAPAALVLLGLSCWIAMDLWPVAMGIVAWFGMVSVTGFALLLLLPYQPRLAMSTPLLGLLISAVASRF